MKKIIAVLVVPIVVLSAVSGLLFNQLVVVQNVNSELKNDLFEANAQLVEVNTQLEEEQNSSLHLETQVIELQNQTEQLEQSLVGLENQRNELEEQVSKATNLVKITDFKITSYVPLGGFIVYSYFNLTIENFGINDVKNVSVSILGADNEPPIIIVDDGFYDEFYVEIPIEVILVDEKMQINGSIHYNFQDGIFPVTVKLMLGDIILHEKSSGLFFN